MIDMPPLPPFQGSKTILDGAPIVRDALPEIFMQGDALEVIDPDFLSRPNEIEQIRTYADPNVAPGSKGLVELSAFLILYKFVKPPLPFSRSALEFVFLPCQKESHQGLVLSGWYGTRNVLVLRVVSPQLLRWVPYQRSVSSSWNRVMCM